MVVVWGTFGINRLCGACGGRCTALRRGDSGSRLVAFACSTSKFVADPAMLKQWVKFDDVRLFHASWTLEAVAPFWRSLAYILFRSICNAFGTFSVTSLLQQHRFDRAYGGSASILLRFQWIGNISVTLSITSLLQHRASDPAYHGFG